MCSNSRHKNQQGEPLISIIYVTNCFNIDPFQFAVCVVYAILNILKSSKISSDENKHHIQLIIEAGALRYLVEVLDSSIDNHDVVEAAIKSLKIIMCGSKEQKQAVLDCDITSYLPLFLSNENPKIKDVVISSLTNSALLQHVVLNSKVGDLKTGKEGNIIKNIFAADFIQPLCEKLKEINEPKDIIVSVF